MKFLADENFPITAFRILQESGYDIKHVAFEMPSVKDTDVTDFAISENRIILTFDGDYGTLIFKFGYRPPGVVYFRLQNITAEEPAYIVINLLKDAYLFEQMHTVVENDKIRQRRIQ
jgi:predicted nuclease of predicted toxin-antitoxin system